MNVSQDDSLFGDSSSSDALTLLISGFAEGRVRRDVYEWQRSGVSVEYSYENGRFTFAASGYHSPIVLILQGIDIYSPIQFQEVVN